MVKYNKGSNLNMSHRLCKHFVSLARFCPWPKKKSKYTLKNLVKKHRKAHSCAQERTLIYTSISKGSCKSVENKVNEVNDSTDIHYLNYVDISFVLLDRIQ